MEPNNTIGFAELLYERMKHILPAIGSLEFYEFEYALKNLQPEDRKSTRLNSSH
jgi:hypothetical protein